MKRLLSRGSLAAATLVAVSLAIHGNALSGWWLFDDPQLVIEAIREPARGVLFDPAEYTHLATHTFTPLLLLSFKLDLFLHGLDPSVFYAHQLAALTITALLFYFLLRRYVHDAFAAAGAAVFLTSWAAVYGARMLMIRHYLEGLMFALAALISWSVALRRSQTGGVAKNAAIWEILASLFYLASMLSKEVYVPLPLFLIWQARHESRSWREIAKHLILPGVALAGFFVWRWAMIGLIGVYPSIILTSEPMELPVTLWQLLVGPGRFWPNLVWALSMGTAGWLGLRAHPLRGLAFFLTAAVAALLPILPLAARIQWRYGFAFVAIAVAVLTIALGGGNRLWPIAVMLLLLATTTVNSIAQRRYYRQVTRRGIEREGRYVWTRPVTASILAASASPWYLDGLTWLRQYEHRGESPPVIFSQYAITLHAVDPQRVVVVDRHGNSIPLLKTAALGTPEEWDRAWQRYEPAAPLSVRFAIRDHDAQWQLGPPHGRFVFLTVPGYSAIPIPPAGRQRVPRAREQQFFRIVRQADDGTWTTSPTLPVPREGAAMVWQRGKISN